MTDSILTPQQQLFLANYTNPNSETFGNALQSALKAKYSQEYSETITAQMPDWLSENLGDVKLLKKAQRNLDLALEGLLDDPEKGGKPIQHKATEFTLKGLQKGKWSERSEHTGKDGKDLQINIISYKDDNTAI
jgi:hypothetical protein